MNMAKGTISIMDKRLLNISELTQYCGIGRNTARDWGKAIGAERRFGKRVLYDRVIIDRALDQQAMKAAQE